MSIILDASMAIAWLFEAETTPNTRAALWMVVNDGAIVPSLWRLEIANVLRNAVRRGRCAQDFADRSLARLGRLPISVDLETDRHAWGDTRTLALDRGLTLYDAAYLELALRLKRPLASADKDLIRAATFHGVKVISP